MHFTWHFEAIFQSFLVRTDDSKYTYVLLQSKIPGYLTFLTSTDPAAGGQTPLCVYSVGDGLIKLHLPNKLEKEAVDFHTIISATNGPKVVTTLFILSLFS